jgi:tetratricopeptide (TPR) repeat protein
MKLFGQLIDRLGIKSAADEHGAHNPAHQMLDSGQWAKRGEELELALEHLNDALQQAEAEQDDTSLAVITLHRAETLIGLERWSQAEHLLLQMRHEAQKASQRAQLAYALITLGTLEQARENWDEARSYYEQALKVAQTAQSLGGEGRALGHLADTYLHEQNASYGVHLLRDALPKLNMSGDIELSSYFVGLLGQGLIETGHDIEGERLLYRALRLAEQMKYRRFERHWALLLARRAVSSMRYEEARQLYQQALPLFTTVANPAPRIETLCEISRICLYLGDVEAGLDHAQQALDSVENTEDRRLQATARGTYGMALRASGRSAEAIAHLEQVLTITHQTTELHIEIMRNLASARADTGDIEAAIRLYRQVLDMTQAIPLELAQTHLELGLLYEKRQEMAAAIDHWKAALTIYENERYYAQVARLYCDIGGARRSLGQGKRAMREFEQALMILSSVDDIATRGIVVSNAAIAYADLGDVESAEAFFDEAVEIAQRLGDAAAKATRLGNYGWFLLSTGRSQRAIPVLEQALELSKQNNLALQIAVQTDNLGLAYNRLRQFDQALAHHQAALQQIEPLDNVYWQSSIKLNIANTLFNQGAVAAARPLLLEALNAGRTLGNVEIITRALIGQARVALAANQPQAADELLEEAIDLARQADLRRYLAEALQVQSEQQAALNQSDRSLSLWDEAQRLFTMLHMPQAELEPEWLKDQPVESSAG